MELKEKLVELRRQKGLTQDELARELGITRQAVSKWERGVIAPATVNLVALGRLYGVPLDELVNGDLEEASGGVAVAVEAGADPPVDEEAPRKRVGWWKGLVIGLVILIAAVTMIYFAMLRDKGQETPRPLPMEDMEWDYIDISNADTLIRKPVD